MSRAGSGRTGMRVLVDRLLVRAFRGWHRAPLLQPGRFTELFFLDEATALAAGHRPCALCRSADFRRFVDCGRPAIPWRRRWQPSTGDYTPSRWMMTGTARGPTRGRTPICPTARWSWPTTRHGSSSAPSSADGASAAATPSGVVVPWGTAEVLTTPSLVGALAAGWSGEAPLLHPSAVELVRNGQGPQFRSC